jgi:O-acetyl-ADP-ribose deacetylase (regulator of RNase III)
MGMWPQGSDNTGKADAMHVEVVQADITAESFDAIVNAANENLAPGGGVCGAIHAAGGPGIAAECRRIGHCPTGGAVATTAGELPARWVIHAVGPVWQGGGRGEPELLASAYRSALDEGARVGARSVAFPAISTGIYGYPADEAAEIAVATVRAFDGPIERVVLCAFDAATYERYVRLLH